MLSAIILTIFRRMRLSHENQSLRHILFWTFKKNSHCQSFIAKTFDGSPIQIKKNKNYYFQLFLNRTCLLIAPFFARTTERANYLCARKDGRVKVSLFIPGIKYKGSMIPLCPLSLVDQNSRYIQNNYSQTSTTFLQLFEGINFRPERKS